MQFAATGWDGVDIGGRQFVVGLIDAGSDEVNARAIERPQRFPLIEVACGQLQRLGEFVRGSGHVEYPDVAVTLGIKIPFVVAAVDGTSD